MNSFAKGKSIQSGFVNTPGLNFTIRMDLRHGHIHAYIQTYGTRTYMLSKLCVRESPLCQI